MLRAESNYVLHQIIKSIAEKKSCAQILIPKCAMKTFYNESLYTTNPRIRNLKFIFEHIYYVLMSGYIKRTAFALALLRNLF